MKFLVNTHHHGDHTGGNENRRKLSAIIIAHDNVRQHMQSTPKRDGSSEAKAALPIITFNDELNLFINGEKIGMFHIGHAHTDGDALLYFTKSNVLHTGGTYSKERYPYIDLDSGGSINGYINAVKLGLQPIDHDTKVIPGHRKLSHKEEDQSFLKMLEDLRSKISEEIKAGKTEVFTKTYDALDYGTGFINSKKIRRTFYLSLKD
ncbi:MBL fold metallo-hydrolase [Psychroserpens burtonensis]|uniref:MBL fold metallo-hydrolase n=1 Tax=Psychroserpens burtonensis TaxID=49278 RepID=UPI001FE1461B|nr:MBL fold metallo-hydrolase [Psychroserpens burtonensis]